MEITDIWNVRFSDAFKRKCADCDQPAKTFWSHDGQLICENCMTERVEDQEADYAMDSRSERTDDGIN